MAAPTRTHLSDLRGATRMALDAAGGITDIVERMHRTIQVLPLPLGRGPIDTTRGSRVSKMIRISKRARFEPMHVCGPLPKVM